jgi:hypothetical protein
MLPKAQETLSRHLDAKHLAEIRPFYDWLQNNIGSFARLSEKENSVYEEMGGLHGHDL